MILFVLHGVVAEYTSTEDSINFILLVNIWLCLSLTFRFLIFQVLHALGTRTRVPVPKVFCLCTDSSVIGTPFYIMEYLEGSIFIDPNLPV